MLVLERGGNLIRWAICAVHFYVDLTKTCCLPERTLIQCDKTLFIKVSLPVN